MDSRLIMQSLPLVAAVLGNKYGITVNIGGKDAFTNGRVINLPSLPIECDETLVGLARGYIDHESAHIRETDFKAIRDAHLIPFEMSIQNIIEDWRVENKLAGVFPGCRANFNWLIHHFFTGDNKETERSLPAIVHNWILLTVRSWDVAEIVTPLKILQDRMENESPYIYEQVVSVLGDIKRCCDSTIDSIRFAKEISSILKTAASQNLTSSFSDEKTGESSEKDRRLGLYRKPLKEGNFQEDLSKIFSATKEDLPKSLGDILSETLTSSITQKQTRSSDRIQVAQVGKKSIQPFPQEELNDLNQVESVLKVRMVKALQAKQLIRGRIGRRGRISSRSLAKIVTASPKVFVCHDVKIAVNTAVHLLMDCSGSMRKRIDLTSKVCCAMARALDSIKGVNVGVTAFPAKTNSGTSVCPIVSHGEKVHRNFSIDSYGGTPMGEAIWWVLQQLTLVKESRKIVLVVTDGYPDSIDNTKAALTTGRSLGVEFYGVGIQTSAVSNLFQGKSCVVNDLSELAPAMYELLSTSIIKR